MKEKSIKTFTSDAPSNIGKTIVLKGWVDDIRDIGKISLRKFLIFVN